MRSLTRDDRNSAEVKISVVRALKELVNEGRTEFSANLSSCQAWNEETVHWWYQHVEKQVANNNDSFKPLVKRVLLNEIVKETK